MLYVTVEPLSKVITVYTQRYDLHVSFYFTKLDFPFLNDFSDVLLRGFG